MVIYPTFLAVYNNLQSTDARCLGFKLGAQCDMVDCALNSVAQSIGISRFTFKFWGPIHIKGMAEARAVKFCTQVDYIKPYQKNKKSPPKKGPGFGSRDPFLHAQLWTKKI